MRQSRDVDHMLKWCLYKNSDVDMFNSFLTSLCSNTSREKLNDINFFFFSCVKSFMYLFDIRHNEYHPRVTLCATRLYKLIWTDKVEIFEENRLDNDKI